MQLKCSVLPNEAEKSSEQELLHFTSYKGRNTGVAGGRSYLNSSPALFAWRYVWSVTAAMAELDLPGVVMNQEYRVKLGKSFTFPKENAFHTIKCMFAADSG